MMWKIIRFICVLLLVIGFTESQSTFIPPLLHKQSPDNDSSTRTTSPPLIHKSSRQIDSNTENSTDKAQNNNNNNYGNYSNSVAVPSEFPRNESEYHFLNNATVLKNLSAHQDGVEGPLLDGASGDEKLAEESNGKVDTEVGDLLTGGSFSDDKSELVNNEGKGEESGKVLDDSGKTGKSVEIPPELIVNETPQEEYPKSEVEWLQNGNDNEDVRLRNNAAVDDNLLQPLAATSAVDSSPDNRNGEQPLVQGRYAAILAGAFVVIAVAGYIALLSWRRYLENRYGNREMLVNEDDIYDPNDLKHFSI